MLEDLLDCVKDLILPIIFGILGIGLMLYIVFISYAKVELHLTREKIKIYQETNIIDEDTKKLLIEKLDV